MPRKPESHSGQSVRCRSNCELLIVPRHARRSNNEHIWEVHCTQLRATRSLSLTALISTPVLACVGLHDHSADSILHTLVGDWKGMVRGNARLVKPAVSNCQPWLTILLADVIAFDVTRQNFLEGHESHSVQRSFFSRPRFATRHLIANRHPPHPLEYVLLVSMSDCGVIPVETVTYDVSVGTSNNLCEQADELMFSWSGFDGLERIVATNVLTQLAHNHDIEMTRRAFVC